MGGTEPGRRMGPGRRRSAVCGAAATPMTPSGWSRSTPRWCGLTITPLARLCGRRPMWPRSGSWRSASPRGMAWGQRRIFPGVGSNYTNLLSGKGGSRCREALGRSRGGLTTKIHLAADQRCRSLAIVTSEGQRHDTIAFEAVLAKIVIDRLGPGRPRTRRTGCWPTRCTRRRRTVPILPGGGSRRRSRSRMTRPRPASGRARPGAAHPSSTRSATGTATP